MRMRSGIALLCVVLAAGCTTTVAGSPTAAKVQRSGPKGAVPPGLEQFYGQPLVWQSCPQFATGDESRQAFAGKGLQCTTMRVPLDYTKPDGPAATIGLLRRPATDQQHRIGSLVVNPGGPGASGMSAAASLASGDPNAQVFTRFDIVGFDPRGIGVSSPKIHCLTDQEMDAKRLEPLTTDVAKTEAENKDYAQKCAQRTGADVLATVGSKDVARDMDVLRSVLGDEKLTYLGFSYGTRIGTLYAEQFPQSVRAMVLDGAVDPDADQIDEEIGQAKGFDGALTKFAAWCTARDDCALGHDPAADPGEAGVAGRPAQDPPGGGRRAQAVVLRRGDGDHPGDVLPGAVGAAELGTHGAGAGVRPGPDGARRRLPRARPGRARTRTCRTRSRRSTAWTSRRSRTGRP